MSYVYLSGPMSGYPDNNYPLFNELAASWRKAGWTVLNPAESFGGDQTRKLEEYMRLDIAMLLEAKAIAMINGWEDSEGAKRELLIAQTLGLRVLNAHTKGPMQVPQMLVISEAASVARNISFLGGTVLTGSLSDQYQSAADPCDRCGGRFYLCPHDCPQGQADGYPIQGCVSFPSEPFTTPQDLIALTGAAPFGNALRSRHQNVLITLPTGGGERKAVPLCTGVLDYFPAALAEVARVSKQGNDQHNPGQPLHWARGKSADHADCVARHLIQRGSRDVDGMRHTAKAAWRLLAMLQEEIEADEGFEA